jgi:hypothetical protein
MKKKGIIIAGLLTTAVLAGVLISFVTGPTPEKFIDHWGTTFTRCNSIRDIKAIPATDRQDLIWVREFTNGEWILARNEYACTDGAGFDATVFRDSNGSIFYQTTHHFCGYEGLCGELTQVKATNLVEFYASLDQDIKRMKWKPVGQQIVGGDGVNPPPQR